MGAILCRHFDKSRFYRPKVRIANRQISRGSSAQRPGYRPTHVLHATVPSGSGPARKHTTEVSDAFFFSCGLSFVLERRSVGGGPAWRAWHTAAYNGRLGRLLILTGKLNNTLEVLVVEKLAPGSTSSVGQTSHGSQHQRTKFNRAPSVVRGAVHMHMHMCMHMHMHIVNM